MSDPHAVPTALRPSLPLGLLWFGITVAAAAPVFRFGFEGLIQEWARPVFQLKAVVPLFSAILALRAGHMSAGKSADIHGRWIGVVALVAALAVAITGNLLRIDDLVFWAIIFWVVALAVTILGVRGSLRYWAALSSLALMLPVPRFVVVPIRQVLEDAAGAIAGPLLRLSSVSAHADGRMIEFAALEMPVSEAAEMTSLFPVMLVLFWFATLSRLPLWTRIVPLLLAAPLQVILAGTKIAMLGVALDRYGTAGAETVLYLTGEATFFAVSLVLLVGPILPFSGLASEGRGGWNSLKQAKQRLAATPSIRASRPLVAAALLSVAASAAFALAPSRPVQNIEREPFRHFPTEASSWRGTVSGISADAAHVLNASDHIHIDFHHPSERAPVSFWSAYYLRQEGDKGGIHSPQDCLPGDGWNIVSLRTIEVRAGKKAEIVALNRAIIERHGKRSLVYYWFEGRGRRIANERLARLAVKFDGFLTGRTDGALVRYATPILPDEQETDADLRVWKLLAETVGKLTRFVPE